MTEEDKIIVWNGLVDINRILIKNSYKLPVWLQDKNQELLILFQEFSKECLNELLKKEEKPK